MGILAVFSCVGWSFQDVNDRIYFRSSRGGGTKGSVRVMPLIIAIDAFVKE